MKTLLIALLFVPFISFAQDLPKNSEGNIEYTAVVNIDSADAQTLYSRAKLFIAQSFKSARNVTDLSDDAAKQIVVKGLIRPVIKWNVYGKSEFGNVFFTTTIQCKEGKYRYFINGFNHENHENKFDNSGGRLENEKPACGTFYMTKNVWQKVKDYTSNSMLTYIKNLQAYMEGKGITATDEW
jgi:hypothetical protein